MRAYGVEENVAVATPTRNPPTGSVFKYFKSDGLLYSKNAAGVEAVINGANGALGVVSAVGYRGSAANQSVAYNTNVELEIQGTQEYGFGTGYSRSGNVVTVANDGVYDFDANVYFNTGSAAGRVYLYIETWTGTDPGIGSATKIAWVETSPIGPAYYGGLHCSGRKSLLAGAKVRCVIYQSITNPTGSTLGASYIHKFDICRIDPVAGALTDSGWTALTLTAGYSALSGYATPSYRKIGNEVHFKGVVTVAASLSAFATLPSGYRPYGGASPELYPVLTNGNTPNTISVATTGAMTLTVMPTAGHSLALAPIKIITD